MIEQINRMADAWWSWMWPMFWQVGVLIALIGGVDLIIRRRVWPQVRYALWLLVLVKLVLPPTFSLSTSITSPLHPLVESAFSRQANVEQVTPLTNLGQPSITPNPATGVSVEPVLIPREPQRAYAVGSGDGAPAAEVAAATAVTRASWRVYLMLAWLLGGLALAAWLMAKFRQFRGAHRVRPDMAGLPPWFGELLAETARKLNLRRVPEVVFSKAVVCPAVFGIFRPVLLLPAKDKAGFSRKDTEHVLLHELAHIKRGDLWAHRVYIILQVIYWFNPLLWCVRRQLRHLRELCCDATVARVLQEKTTDYRQTILQSARRLLAEPLTPGMGLLGLFEDSNHLAARLKWLEKKTWRYRGLRIATVFAAVALMLACVLPMAAGEAKPQVLTVAAGGDAMYVSIQKAIDAAPVGALVRVAPGLYEERLKIDKPLTLEGAGWDQTTIMTRSAGADVFEEAMRKLRIQVQAAKSDEERKAIGAKFEAEFKETYGMPTVLVSGAEGVVIRNLKLTSPGRALEGRSMSVPIVRFSKAKARLTECAVLGTPGDGIHVLDGSDVEIRDCLVAAVWSTGIAVGGASAKILNCDIRNCHHRCVTIGRGGGSTVVRNCRISGSAWHGIRYDNCSPTIVGNLIFANARSGIYASGTTAATVRQNVFYANEMVGVSCWFQNQDTIEGNTFAENKRSGLEVLGASKPAVRKNIFFANPIGVYCGDIGSDSPLSKSDGVVTLQNNLFWGNERKAIWRVPKTTEHQTTTEESIPKEILDYLGKESGFEDVELTFDERAGNVEMDPMFVDAEREDFSLRADSPARPSGIGAAEPLGFESPWPIQPEESAIIPEGQTRDSRKWKTGILSLPAGAPAAAAVDPAGIALLYHSDSKVRIQAVKELAAAVDPALIDDLIRAHSVENYTPVHNEYGQVLRSLTGERNVRGKGAWKAWLAGAAKTGSVKIDYLPIKPDPNNRDKIAPYALEGPDSFGEMAAALTAESYDRRKCRDALIYMVFNDHLPQVQQFLSGDWLSKLFANRNIDINHVGYVSNGLANPGPLRERINAQVRSCLDSDNPAVAANALNLIAGVEGYSTRFIVPGVEAKVEELLSSSQPEVAIQAQRAMNTIRPSQAKPVPSGASKTVPTVKSDLQRMIDSAQPGGTVTIPKGVYTDPVVITKPLTLKGRSRTNCVFEVTSNRPAIFIDTKGKGRVTIDAVTIRWQLATSNRTEYPFAVAVKDTKAEVKNCCFQPLGNFKRCPVAINSLGFSEMVINTCRFEGFEYTVCFGAGSEGTIQNCLVTGSGHQGISLYSGATAKIFSNIVTGSKYHGVRSTGGTLYMKDNLIINNDNRGVYLGNKSAGGTIENNIIMGNGTGIGGFAQSKVKIANNIIADSSYAGIGMRDSCSLVICDNIFKGNERGWIMFKEGSRGGNVVRKNTFWQNKVDTENLDKPADSISADPRFADADNGDFSLKPGPASEQRQGLTEPQVFKWLWPRWKSRADKTEPFKNTAQPPPRAREAGASTEPKVSPAENSKPAGHPGRISGVVVNSVTGKPIAGAYVGVGDFGDSGGSNYSRHRSQGFHDKTKTDDNGRFELDGLALTDTHRYLKAHPLVVTHPEFVRHDQQIELSGDKPVSEVKVALRQAAEIKVTVVDSGGNPVEGHWLLRLEALDGRRFIAPGSDPHLSSFASSIWAHWPDMRRKMGLSQGFTFTELDTGEYLIEAIRFHLVDNPTPQNIWEPTVTYHGAIASLKIHAGQTKEVKLSPQDHQTSLTITPPEFPDKLMDKLERSKQMPQMCLISRNPALLLWDDGMIHHLEDQRLGRIDKQRFFRGFFPQGKPLTIKNLPPGSYSIFAMAVYGQVASSILGTRVDLAAGDDSNISIPWRLPTGASRAAPNRAFDDSLKLEAGEYSVSELCGILTSITQSNPRIIADSSIENEKLRFGRGQLSVWDVLEKLYLDKGCTVEEGQDKTLVIKRAEQTGLPVEPKHDDTGVTEEPLLAPSGRAFSKDSQSTPVIKPHITIEHKDGVDTVLFSPDGESLISESFSDGVKICDALNGGLLRTLPLRGYSANSVALSQDGAVLAMGTNTGKVYLWNTQTLRLEKAFPVTKWSIYAIALSPDDEMLASCAADGTVQLWDIENSKQLETLGKKGPYRISSMSFSPDSNVLATLSRDGRADMWYVADRKLIRTVPTGADCWGSCSITFCPDQNTVAIATPGLVQVWKPENDNELLTINVPDSINPWKALDDVRPMSKPIFVGMVVLSPDCKKAASVIKDGTIAIWDVLSRIVEQKLIGSCIADLAGGGMQTMVFSPDKKLFASGNKNGKVQLWKLTDLKKQQEALNSK